ncbi:MAG: peroxiredoxin [Opitutaceae bacterium]
MSAQSVELPTLIFQPPPMSGTDSELRVAIGDIAPDFKLPSINGEVIQLSDYRGDKNVVISFVPAAWTPVCSSQWPGYNLALDYFKESDAVILGITVDNLPTLYAWTTAMSGIDFPVLSDFYPHGEVAQSYGVLRSSGVSERALFVIDKQGIIRYIDVHDINERPPLEELVNAVRALK